MDGKKLCELISKCLTPSHYVDFAREQLKAAGYSEIKEDEDWSQLPSKFFVVRDERTIVAANVKDTTKGVLVCSNSDIPIFKTKPRTKDERVGIELVRIAPYGKARWYTWIDRDLKVAGRVIYKDPETNTIKASLFSSEKSVAIMPSLAIHLSSEQKFNLEDNFCPMISLEANSSLDLPSIPEHLLNQSPSLVRLISQLIKTNPENICDFEASFIDSNLPTIMGTGGDMISASGLGYILGAIESLFSFISSDPSSGTNILAVYDSVCVGSNLRCGANSNLLPRVLTSIGGDSFVYRCSVYAYVPYPAWNPNYKNNSDEDSKLLAGKGIVIENADGMQFTARASAIITAKKAGIDIQNYNPLNKVGFSPTSLNVCIEKRLGVPTAAIGIPINGFGAVRESCMINDAMGLYKFFSSAFSH